MIFSLLYFIVKVAFLRGTKNILWAATAVWCVMMNRNRARDESGIKMKYLRAKIFSIINQIFVRINLTILHTFWCARVWNIVKCHHFIIGQKFCPSRSYYIYWKDTDCIVAIIAVFCFRWAAHKKRER